ncbi:MAG: SRPBCC family protein [Mycobacterium sp.]|nr:SRPBCC family protein [Mycobacterium sp.]
MATLSRFRTIAASPRAVWDVLADFGAISSWAPNVDHSCILEHGPDGPVGTSRRVQAGRYTLVERITECTAPEALAYDIEGLPRQLGRVSNRWAVSGFGKSTAVRLTTTVEIGSNPLAHVAELAACRIMAKQSDVMLGGLAARLGGNL